MTLVEALFNLKAAFEYNFSQDGNKLVYDANLESFEYIKNMFEIFQNAIYKGNYFKFKDKVLFKTEFKRQDFDLIKKDLEAKK